MFDYTYEGKFRMFKKPTNGFERKKPFPVHSIMDQKYNRSMTCPKRSGVLVTNTQVQTFPIAENYNINMSDETICLTYNDWDDKVERLIYYIQRPTNTDIFRVLAEMIDNLEAFIDCFNEVKTPIQFNNVEQLMYYITTMPIYNSEEGDENNAREQLLEDRHISNDGGDVCRWIDSTTVEHV